jgi:hypothetical protein
MDDRIEQPSSHIGIMPSLKHCIRKRKAHDRYDDYGMGFSYGLI